MSRTNIGMIERFWNRITGEIFIPLAFAKQIRRHGGHDMSNISEEDVVQLLQGHYEGDWRKIAFSFSELLASYSVRDERRSKQEIVGWVFASLVIANAIAAEAAEWEMQFDLFMNGFLEVRNELTTDEAVEVFHEVFSQSSPAERGQFR